MPGRGTMASLGKLCGQLFRAFDAPRKGDFAAPLRLRFKKFAERCKPLGIASRPTAATTTRTPYRAGLGWQLLSPL